MFGKVLFRDLNSRVIPNPLFIKSTDRFVINFLNHSTFGFRDHTRKFGWRISCAESTKTDCDGNISCNAIPLSEAPSCVKIDQF